MAVYDSSLGCLCLLKNRDRINFFIDEKYPYGVLDESFLKARVSDFYETHLRDNKVNWICDYEASKILKDRENTITAIDYMKRNLANNTVSFASSNSLNDQYLNSLGRVIDAQILINAANDALSDALFLNILSEFEIGDFKNIFLASSALHLKKDIIRDFYNISTFSYMDFLLCSYYKYPENKLRDKIFTTDDKRSLTKRAERILKMEVLHVREI